MTRHAKNVTAGNIYTTHERKKDARQSGYGSEAIRLGKDSIKVLVRYIFAFLMLLMYLEHCTVSMQTAQCVNAGRMGEQH